MSEQYERISISDLEIKGSRESGQVRSTCPHCRDYKQHGNAACVSINLDTGFGQCFKCGTKFLLKERAQKWQQHTRSFNKKKAYKRPSLQGLEKAYNGTLVDYVLKRGLDPQQCLSHGIFMAKRKFSGIERDCLAFAFYEGSQIINIQYKTTDKQFSFEADCELIPYGIDNVLGCDEMIITEGLFDAEAMIEAGFPNTVSVPNGAGTDFKRSFERFKYSHFADIKTVYIAGDNDEEGLKCRENIAAYFGEARCKQVEWPDDCKDANDVMMKYGKDRIGECIKSAKDCPIKGAITLQDINERLDVIYEEGLKPGLTIGVQGLDHLVRFELGRIMVISGYPGTGKSSFEDFLILSLANQHGWKTAIFTPEKYPTELHYMELAEMLTAKKFYKDKMPIPMMQHVEKWLSENVFHIDGEGGAAIDDILHVALQLKQRYGINVFALDPFNYVDLPMIAGANDTQKISDVLKKIVAFAHQQKVFVIVVAHPKKPDDIGKTEKAASLYDIAGSADFYNKCDYGIILNRDKVRDLTFVNVLKIRFRHLGQTGKCALKFDRKTGRFVGCRETTDEKNDIIYTPLQYDYDNWINKLPTVQKLPFEGEEEDAMPF